MSSSYNELDRISFNFIYIFICISYIKRFYSLEAWVSIYHVDVVKKSISNIKKMGTNAKNCRARYLTYLSWHGLLQHENQTSLLILTLRFMPLPSSTRWNSWFTMAFYVEDYLDYIRGFY